jgi:hypothetical protein
MSIIGMILVDGHFPREEGVLRFGYLGKWSPFVCELLNT